MITNRSPSGDLSYMHPTTIAAYNGAASAHNIHLDFTPTAAALKAFRKELEMHTITRDYLQVPV